MEEIILNDDGTIDWNANGWPEPNSEYDSDYDGYSVEGMPDDIFEIWEEACSELDIDWSSDF